LLIDHVVQGGKVGQFVASIDLGRMRHRQDSNKLAAQKTQTDRIKRAALLD
jgi:hypothetical protein